MREPIAPLWKGNGPLHFLPHIQVSLSLQEAENFVFGGVCGACFDLYAE